MGACSGEERTERSGHPTTPDQLAAALSEAFERSDYEAVFRLSWPEARRLHTYVMLLSARKIAASEARKIEERFGALSTQGGDFEMRAVALEAHDADGLDPDEQGVIGGDNVVELFTNAAADDLREVTDLAGLYAALFRLHIVHDDDFPAPPHGPLLAAEKTPDGVVGFMGGWRMEFREIEGRWYWYWGERPQRSRTAEE